MAKGPTKNCKSTGIRHLSRGPVAWATGHTDPLEVREEETELCHLEVAATRVWGTLRAGSIVETEPVVVGVWPSPS